MRYLFRIFSSSCRLQQPERLQDISRGLKPLLRLIPPVNVVRIQHPEGVPERFWNRAICCDPFRVVAILRCNRGYRRVAPQPPANFWQAVGLHLA